ncbi:hypothetical protein J3E68DRAFT_115513 [Trichoderma sp. SZMC 28012]
MNAKGYCPCISSILLYPHFSFIVSYLYSPDYQAGSTTSCWRPHHATHDRFCHVDDIQRLSMTVNHVLSMTNRYAILYLFIFITTIHGKRPPLALSLSKTQIFLSHRHTISA